MRRAALAGPVDIRMPLSARTPSLSLVSKRYHGAMAMTLRTDDELDEALTTLAKAEGLSKQEVIRMAVLEKFARAGHGAKVKQSAEAQAERWKDVLDRLGSV